MKDMIRYLFQPSKNDREAIKSAYYESVGPTRVTMFLALAAAITFLILTVVYPPYFGGTTVVYHQLCYIWVIAVAGIWLFGVHYAMKDYYARYRIVFVLNHFMGVSLYLWVVSLMIVNSMARGTVDTTLFMTVALVVPLCVYLNPIVYVVTAVLSNIGVISFLYYMVSKGSIEPNEMANFLIFSVFQVVMGLIMSYTRLFISPQSRHIHKSDGYSEFSQNTS